MDIVTWIDEVDNSDVDYVGGKAASLGEMRKANLPVPEAFVVTAKTFRKFINETGLDEKVFGELDKIDVDDSNELKEVSGKIRQWIKETETPEYIKKEIRKAYKEISKRGNRENEFVAVRSSATAEDLPDASFAGQQETFLNKRGIDSILDAIKDCWASLYTGRAIFYRENKDFEHSKVDIAVIVQKMIDSDKAGVLFTSHPTTGEKEVIIEAGWGLGEGVVSGSVSPDHYIVDRENMEITKEDISTKQTMFVKDEETGETVEKEVQEDKKDKKVLSHEEIIDLAELANRVEDHYRSPQDVEWAIEEGKIHMLQSRPITTISEEKENKETETTGEVIVSGLGASPGLATGKVKVVRNLDELDKIKKGDILVTPMTTPDMVPSMKKASGIITDEGGMTCHAAIVARELGTPAIVGTKDGTKILEDGIEVTLDGEKGKVIKGEVQEQKKEQEKKEIVRTTSDEVTATDVKVNVSIPEAAERAAKTNADGVGLLRIEHMVLNLNKHPQFYIRNNKEEELINELFEGVRKVADEFYPKPVWVRTLDAPTDEFRSLEGGDHEPHENNPMLGFRGIRRSLSNSRTFKLQIRAIEKLSEKGYDNIGLMLPLIQDPNEVRKAREIIDETGLDMKEIDFGVMIETPAAAILIDKIIDEGIDFVSFGTNDLTQYTLAVDRNNENVSSLYQEKHPAVLELMENVIKKCNERGVETSICGQAGSYPDVVEKLIKYGISSISSNIDAVHEIKKTVAKTEKRIILESVRQK
ncbi:MAG: Phosphoenolpyruvate synthase/pyruvate phosphate dikinase PpsA [Candidatus Methanohalarchaeum thermophilum]|uniref:Phosphoenolpyruvate synthase n=1 Tax=Methanohalarchaeum thermophilum TaxID=1903181 RepID=A0A1Q6DXZ9_METT1|nr:MAG: Phosphoenolpyruvate synthase/pyruvate phosphate dikinase PpsA [Candidatus Methanohalarchaeum thermophilum]